MSVSLPFTSKKLDALTKKEPNINNFQATCKGRTFCFLNALAYSLQILWDPVFYVSQTIVHLFKTTISLCDTRKPDHLQIAKCEAVIALDACFNIAFSPVINCALIIKFIVGTIFPRVCYKQATAREIEIIQKYLCYKACAHKLMVQAVKHLTALNLSSQIDQKMILLKKSSKQISQDYCSIKCYAL